MKNYTIQYDPADKHSILNIVRQFSNDITTDTIEEDRVRITIELDDEEADELFEKLNEEINAVTDVRARHYTGD